MQCARCQGYSREITSRRLRLGKAKWINRPVDNPRKSNEAWEIKDSSWLANGTEDDNFETGTFLENYLSVIVICAVTGLFSSTAIVFLSLSALHLGMLAVPFLGIFAAGLVLSIGLPFKIRKEYLMIKDG